MTHKISPEEFVKLAIARLRNEPYKGIHSVYSGFNEAFKKYFAGGDPIQLTNQMAEDGKIALRPVKGSVVLFLPEDGPKTSRADAALQRMGLL